MYWFKPKKRYDPRPFSRIRAAWHFLTGCPIQNLRFHRGVGSVSGQMMATCLCGLAWEVDFK